MISDVMFEAIQNQITVERTNSAVYAQLAVEMEREFWPGFAKFFRKNSSEETSHAQRFIDYLTDQDRYPALDALPGITGPATVLAAFEAALSAEVMTTAKIKALYDQARADADYATETALDWFVAEQVQSVKEFQQWVAEVTRADAAYLKLLDEQLGGD